MSQTQTVKIIDIERSYVPIDPMSFPESMHSTQGEDTPEKRIPVIPYDGHNFMPTGYGYQSYFGINSELDVDILGTGGEGSQTAEEVIIEYSNAFFSIDPPLTTIEEYYAWFGVADEAALLAYVGMASLEEYALSLVPDADISTGPFIAYNVDELFIVQTETFQNILVALGEDGIRTKYGGADGAWSQPIVLDAPTAGTHLNWTYCVIGNDVFLYRATGDFIYLMNDDNSWVPTAHTPTELNMEGQLGIFKAGGRLGTWDSENSIGWGDAEDKFDFVPSLKTGAGATIFQQIVGRISAVRQHGNGFIIYATRSIVSVQRTTDAYQFWSAETVFNENGVSYLHECCQGQPDTTHFAYTTFGMVKLESTAPYGKVQAEYIIPEIFSYLKEARQPVYLRLLEGRYLFVEVLDDRYITPNVAFDTEEVGESTLSFKKSSYFVDNVQENVCKALNAVDSNQIGQYLYDTYGILGPLPT